MEVAVLPNLLLKSTKHTLMDTHLREPMERDGNENSPHQC